jgi:hypothetical protein
MSTFNSARLQEKLANLGQLSTKFKKLSEADPKLIKLRSVAYPAATRTNDKTVLSLFDEILVPEKSLLSSNSVEDAVRREELAEADVSAMIRLLRLILQEKTPAEEL